MLERLYTHACLAEHSLQLNNLRHIPFNHALGLVLRLIEIDDLILALLTCRHRLLQQVVGRLLLLS